MGKELDLIEKNKKYYEQELADMEYKWFGIKRNKTKDEQIADLKNQLALTEKALELACEYLNDYQYFDSDCPRYSDCHEIENSKFWDCSNCDCSKLAIEHFKTKAKEIINESNND